MELVFQNSPNVKIPSRFEGYGSLGDDLPDFVITAHAFSNGALYWVVLEEPAEWLAEKGVHCTFVFDTRTGKISPADVGATALANSLRSGSSDAVVPWSSLPEPLASHVTTQVGLRTLASIREQEKRALHRASELLNETLGLLRRIDADSHPLLQVVLAESIEPALQTQAGLLERVAQAVCDPQPCAMSIHSESGGVIAIVSE